MNRIGGWQRFQVLLTMGLSREMPPMVRFWIQFSRWNPFRSIEKFVSRAVL
jgi:hypothetical protein